MRVMVITPTTGKDTVIKAIGSVNSQTVPTEHLIVKDGKVDNPLVYTTKTRKIRT